MNDLDLLSTADVAKALNLSPDMVRVLARSGCLQAAARSARGVRLFRRSDVEALRVERSGEASHSHSVQFYEDDDFMIGIVANFILTGLRAKAPALVIATPKHLIKLRRLLKKEGFDVGKARSSRNVTMLDADDVIAELMVGDMPTRARFRAVIAPLLDEAAASAPRGRLRVFGEAVDLLWKRGQPRASIRLEQLWNDFIRKRPMTVLCMYCMKGFRRSEVGHAEVFRQICDAHASVSPSESFPLAGRDEQLRALAELQQKAWALDAETERRIRAELELHRVTVERDAALAALERRRRTREQDS